MGKFYLDLILVISLVNSAYSFNLFSHKFMDYKEWREPTILNKNVLHAVTENFISQLIDNFDASENETYLMRYYENEYYFEEGGPIIIMLGGEWQISPNALQAGFVHDLTKEQKGVMFYTEHRYYGISRPTNDLTSKSLRHLSVDQALADVAFFIESLKHKNPAYKKSPVIVIGGSYSANMAVWMRSKYPHLVQGALASSAPVYAKTNFHEYLDVVTDVLRLHGEDCVNSVKQAFAEVLNLTETKAGFKELQQLLHLCAPVITNHKKDVIVLFQGLTSVFKGMAQYDRPQGNSTLSASVCEVMKNEEIGPPIRRLAVFAKPGFGCNDISYDKTVKYLRNTKYGRKNTFRQWFYQTCTEYGYYQTSDRDGSIFGRYDNVEYYGDLCKDVYGENYNKDLLDARVKRTNMIYGGRHPVVNNVIFTNGSKDPWHVLSTLKSLNDLSPSYFINGTSHCYDLQEDRSTDSEELRSVRKQVKADIAKIIELAKLKL